MLPLKFSGVFFVWILQHEHNIPNRNEIDIKFIKMRTCTQTQARRKWKRTKWGKKVKQVTRSNTRSRGSDAKNEFDENEIFKLKFKCWWVLLLLFFSHFRVSSHFFFLQCLAMFYYNFIMHEGDGGYDDFSQKNSL